MDLGADQKLTFQKRVAKKSSFLEAPFGSWGLGKIDRIAGNEEQIRSWRHGVVSTSKGSLRGLWGRWWNYQANLAQAWFDQRFRPLAEDECWLYYTLPKSTPGFLTLRYIRSGRRASIATVYGSLGILEQIAAIHRSYAIVCSSSNKRLTERMFERWGFERHARRLPGYHYIKRLQTDLS